MELVMTAESLTALSNCWDKNINITQNNESIFFNGNGHRILYFSTFRVQCGAFKQEFMKM